MSNELKGVSTPATERGKEQARNSAPNVSQQVLLLMAGFAGAGKTTLARRLQHQLEWILLNKDDLKLARLIAAGKKERADPDIWKAFVDQAGKEAFDELLEQMKVALGTGKSVIVDTSNEKPSIFEEIKTIQVHLQTAHIYPRLLILLCVANKTTRTERLNVRGSVFKPYVDEHPPILDDTELSERFRHLFPDGKVVLDDTELSKRFRHLLPDANNVIFVDTNHTVEIENIVYAINNAPCEGGRFMKVAVS